MLYLMVMLSLNKANQKIQSPDRGIQLSKFARIVYALLQAGAQLNETSSDLNPCVAHLKPTKIMKPDTQILMMLLAAGAGLKNELFIHDDSL